MEHYSMECQWCGNRFRSDRSDQKYCSPQCAVKANRAERNGEAHRAPARRNDVSMFTLETLIIQYEDTIAALLDVIQLLKEERRSQNSSTDAINNLTTVIQDGFAALKSEMTPREPVRYAPPPINSSSIPTNGHENGNSNLKPLNGLTAVQQFPLTMPEYNDDLSDIQVRSAKDDGGKSSENFLNSLKQLG